MTQLPSRSLFLKTRRFLLFKVHQYYDGLPFLCVHILSQVFVFISFIRNVFLSAGLRAKSYWLSTCLKNTIISYRGTFQNVSPFFHPSLVSNMSAHRTLKVALQCLPTQLRPQRVQTVIIRGSSSLSVATHNSREKKKKKTEENMQQWSRLWLTACCSPTSPCLRLLSEMWPSDVRAVLQICWQRAPKSHHFVRRSWGSWDVAVVRYAPGRKGSFAASTHRGAPADWGATPAPRPSRLCSSSYRAWAVVDREWSWMYIPLAVMSRLPLASRSCLKLKSIVEKL